ncbi:MAG: acyl-CoA dehydrogenase family protein [Proteobacteria bacterium]|nr:acyl-CoA dehydrogenase family protein [Pseudomonadota bacterium]MBU1740714.1 acyl-CoA dehydrogenase family protein [Pseudomonadota bacterium]
MDFDLTDEQRRLQNKARQFAQNELLPHATRWDRNGEFPRDLVRKMGEAGLLGSTVPREYGGLGTDRVTNGLIVEELARGDSNLSLLAYGTLYEMLSLASEELKREWAPLVAKGERFLGIALTEPQSGSDAANVQTRAERRGDVYLANGVKNCVSILNADGWTMLARTGTQTGPRGISMFLLHRETPGLIISSPKSDMGGRAVPRGSLTLEDARIPAAHLMGQENHGFYYIMDTFDYNRALIGLMCIGAARQSLEETIQYVQGRQSFGRPISTNQGVSFPVAEAETYLELARNLCFKVLWLRDNDHPHRKETAMCKWWVPQICVEIIHQCLLIHGHYGYSQDLPLEQRLRDVLGWEIGDGTAQIQKLIIARELIGKDFVG